MGGFSKILGKRVGNLYSVDHVKAHVLVTKYRCPEGKVYEGDVTNLEFENELFDVSVLRGVIEHVGDHSIPTGSSGPNMRRQFSAVRELARVTKAGGTVALSTGNYLHPWDGEVNRWLFHWLPKENKEAVTKKTGISADKYWLLTWDELSFMFKLCGLRVENIYTDNWDGMFDRLAQAFPDLDSNIREELRQLMHNDPRFMSSWFVLAEKEAASRLPYSAIADKCYYARIRGACEPFPLIRNVRP